MAGANVVDIEVTGNETVSDTLESVADAAVDSARDIARSMGDTEQAFDQAARSSGRWGEALDTASGAGSQFSGGLGDIGGAMTAFTDLQSLGEQRTFAHAQAMLDAEQAQRDYDAAVSEFGPTSLEAQKAQLALNMAQSAAEPPSTMQEWGETLELLSPVIMAVVGVTDLLALANTALHATNVRQMASTIATKTATIAGAAATGIATAAQWAWNIAMNANPIGLIILAVMALVGVIIYIATKTTWFQQLWSMIWGVIGDPVKAFVGWLSTAWDAMVKGIGAAVTWVKNIIVASFRFAIDFVVGYFKFIFSIPGRVIDVFQSIGNAISAPFRGAFNAIARAWNNTVGRLSFTVPDWVPGLGGRGFSMPRLPQFNVGADIMRTGLAIVHAGERIQPAIGNGLGSSGGRGVMALQVPMGNDPRIAIAELAAWAINSGYLNLTVGNVPVVVAR
jgi:hypothetical protein